MAALFTRLQGAAGFLTASRELQIFSDVKDQPGLFLVDRAESYPGRATGMPTVVIFDAEAWVYINTPPLGPALNTLLDAIDTVLAPTPVFNGVLLQNTQTLGGLVQHCWIEGTVEKAFSHKQRQGIAVVPIRMLVPQ